LDVSVLRGGWTFVSLPLVYYRLCSVQFHFIEYLFREDNNKVEYAPYFKIVTVL